MTHLTGASPEAQPATRRAAPGWTQNIDSIPTLPTVAGRLIEMALSEETTANEIGDLISKDPALTAKLLKAVNSSSYGMRSEVKSVSHAISIIGRSALRSLVLGISIFDTLKEKENASNVDRAALWRHAVATAAAAQLIAENVGKVNAEEAYLAGLMHDIGKVVLDMLRGAEYNRAVGDATKQSLDHDREFEEKYCGIDHTGIGSLLAERWSLPLGLRAAIQYHHDPSAANSEPTPIRRIVAVTRAADIVAYRCGYPSIDCQQPPEIDKVTSDLLARIPEATIIERVKEEVRKCAEVFRYGEAMDSQTWQKRLYAANTELSKAFSHLADTQRIQQKSTELIIDTQRLLGKKDIIELALAEIVSKLGFSRAFFLQISEDAKEFTIFRTVSADGRGSENQGRTFRMPGVDVLSKPVPALIQKGQNGTFDAILQIFGVPAAMITPIMDEKGLCSILGTDRGVKLAAALEASTVDLMVHQLFAPSFSLLLANDRLYKKAHYLSVTDVLTGVSNRRALMETYHDIAARSAEKNAPFVVAMYDIDHFKKFNDESGHQVGDKVLRAVAQTIRQNSRSYDVTGRYGGEEFCLVMPNTTGAEAIGVSERVRSAVEALGRANAQNHGGRIITVSGGLAAFRPGENPEALLSRADAALYRAKQNGRNRVEVAKPDEKQGS